MTERLGVFGGTFDPPHIGHLAVARAAKGAADLDRVVFVPAGSPWQKDDRAVSAAEDRYRMTELAIAEDDDFVASRVEVDRDGPSYTVETLERLAAEAGDRELVLILGADAAAGIATWRGPDRICALAELAVVNRPGVAAPDLGKACRVTHVAMDPVDVSATDVRRRLGAGLDVAAIVPEGVAAYARARGLYGAR